MMVWFGTLSVPIVEKLPVADIFDSAKLLLINLQVRVLVLYQGPLKQTFLTIGYNNNGVEGN